MTTRAILQELLDNVDEDSLRQVIDDTRHDFRGCSPGFILGATLRRNQKVKTFEDKLMKMKYTRGVLNLWCKKKEGDYFIAVGKTPTKITINYRNIERDIARNIGIEIIFTLFKDSVDKWEDKAISYLVKLEQEGLSI